MWLCFLSCLVIFFFVTLFVLQQGVCFGLFRPGESDPILTAVTDENGRFTFENIPFGDYYLEELEAPDYTYRVDTDVISSIMLTSATEVNPKNPAKATFYINGGTYTVSNIVMPSGETERSSIRGNSRTTVWTLRFCC